MFKTLTLASIYELQGYRDEALIIYEEILKKDPENFEAKKAIKRLKNPKKPFKGVNERAKNLFIHAHKMEDLKTFERWLLSWN